MRTNYFLPFQRGLEGPAQHEGAVRAVAGRGRGPRHPLHRGAGVGGHRAEERPQVSVATWLLPDF